MCRVYKYELQIEDLQALMLPVGAQILSVQAQVQARALFGDGRDTLQLWALVDPDAPKEPRQLRVAGTGHAITENVKHIDTVIMAGGALVWHVFEILPT